MFRSVKSRPMQCTGKIEFHGWTVPHDWMGRDISISIFLSCAQIHDTSLDGERRKRREEDKKPAIGTAKD